MRHGNHRRAKSWFVIGLSLVAIGLLVFGGYVVFDEFIKKTYEYGGLSLQAASRIIETGEPLILSVNLRLAEQDRPNLVYDVGSAVITPKIVYPPKCAFVACLSGRRETYSSTAGLFFEVSEPDYSFDSFCATPDVNSKQSHFDSPRKTSQASFRVSDSVNERFFPFDEWHTGSVFLWLDMRDKAGQPVSVEPKIVVSTVLPDWEGRVSLEPYQITVNGQKTAAYQMDVTLRRLVSIRFLTVLLLFLSAFAITAVLLGRDQTTAIELIVAVLLGLWGIQDVLIPANIQVTTITHLLITLLYAYLVVMAFLRFFLIPAIRKLKGNPE